jgi:hypothetical protein
MVLAMVAVLLFIPVLLGELGEGVEAVLATTLQTLAPTLLKMVRQELRIPVEAAVEEQETKVLVVMEDPGL